MEKGLHSQDITDVLAEEGLKLTRQGIAKFIKRYIRTRSLARVKGSGRPAKVLPRVKKLVQIRADDEKLPFSYTPFFVLRGYAYHCPPLSFYT